MRYTIISYFVLFSLGLSAQGVNPFDVSKGRIPISKVEVKIDTIFEDNSTALMGSDSLIVIDSDIVSESRNNPFEVGLKNTEGNNRPIVLTPSAEKKTSTSISPENMGNRNLNKGILALICFLILVTISFAVTSNRAKFMMILSSLYNSNSLKNLFRSAKSWFDLQGILLYVAFALSSTLFVFLIIKKGILPYNISWGFILLAIVLIYLIRHLFLVIIAYIFPVESAIDMHNFSIGVHNMIISIFLFPISLGMIFGPPGAFQFLMFLGISLTLIVYLLRQFKGFLMAITLRGFNTIYFFIYLCAIEIAPFLVLFRFVSNGT